MGKHFFRVKRAHHALSIGENLANQKIARGGSNDGAGNDDGAVNDDGRGEDDVII